MLGFVPDTAMVADVVPSPNHGERHGTTRPDILLLHYTGMRDAHEALARLCDPASGVSAHYLVFEDGRIVQNVPEARRAWHAGVSSWEGAVDINSRSIGIEIANPGHAFGYPDFPERQIVALVALCRDILGRQPIQPEHVLAHSDVAPDRKEDPGEKFPWERLSHEDIGLWVLPTPLDASGPVLRSGDAGDSVRQLQSALRSYGYGIETTEIYDAATVAVVTAFQRHFRPARVDGVADKSVRMTLAALLKARGLDPAM